VHARRVGIQGRGERQRVVNRNAIGTCGGMQAEVVSNTPRKMKMKKVELVAQPGRTPIACRFAAGGACLLAWRYTE